MRGRPGGRGKEEEEGAAGADLLHEVPDAPGCANDDVGALSKQALLFLLANATHDRRNLRAGRASVTRLHKRYARHERR